MMKKADYEIERLRLLAHEYQLLQTSIENFDTRALTIKAWSVTFSAAGLTFAYQQKIPIILLVAAASAAAFWIVDTLWKVHQHAFYERVEQIEAIFRGPGNFFSLFSARHLQHEIAAIGNRSQTGEQCRNIGIAKRTSGFAGGVERRCNFAKS